MPQVHISDTLTVVSYDEEATQMQIFYFDVIIKKFLENYDPWVQLERIEKIGVKSIEYEEPSGYTGEHYGVCFEAYILAQSKFDKLVDGEKVQVMWKLFTTNDAFANKTKGAALRELDTTIGLGCDIYEYTKDERQRWIESEEIKPIVVPSPKLKVDT